MLEGMKGHTLIIGMTGSGKSTLCKKVCQRAKRNGFNTVVLDPLGYQDWGADFITKHPEQFMSIMYKNQGCYLFIDESGMAVGKYDTEMEKAATLSRHYSHRVFFVTQRGAQLNKTVRDQCENLFVFRVSKKDAEILAQEYADDDLLKASQLPRYCYIVVSRFAKARFFKLEK